MQKDSYKTKVSFHKDKEGNIFAYFPKEIYSENKKIKWSYSHVGQHSGCHVDYVKGCERASIEEYADLKNELEQIGYNLEVL